MTLYRDQVFAPLDLDHQVERIAGGNESEVYRTDDGRYVIKMKCDLGGDVDHAVAWAQAMRTAAEEFATCLGPYHSVPSYYMISRDDQEQVQVLILQPHIATGRPLAQVDYAALSPDEREQVALQLEEIIQRSIDFYARTGSMPDLYGRSSADKDDRARLNAPNMRLWRVWSFLVQRNLLRSHNLMMTEAPDSRIVLIDYDPVRRSWLYRTIYYAVRRLLFWRDRLLLQMVRWGGTVPRV